MVPAAIGTETDGSITCPAAINGIVGFKPTVGLVSRTHVVPISHSQDTPGPMTPHRARRRSGPERHRRHRSRRSGHGRGGLRAGSIIAAGLRPDALRGVRIGVMRFASGFGTDAALRGGAGDAPRAGRRCWSTSPNSPGREEIGRNELDGAADRAQGGPERLSGDAAGQPCAPAPSPTSSPSTARTADEELALFGQELFEQAEATTGLRRCLSHAPARPRSGSPARRGSTRVLRDNNVVALVGADHAGRLADRRGQRRSDARAAAPATWRRWPAIRI